MLFDWDVHSCGKKKPFSSFLTWKRKMFQANCVHISKTLCDWPHTERLWCGNKTAVKEILSPVYILREREYNVTDIFLFLSCAHMM